jgi:uncharacterized protein (TIGR02001 family)
VVRVSPVIALAMSIGFTQPAFSQTSGNVTVGSDYVNRGVSQTFGDPAVMVYVEHQFKSNFYVAGFVANVDFDNDATQRQVGDEGSFLETDATVGYRGQVGSMNYETGFSFVSYQGTKPIPSSNPRGNWNTVEAFARVSRNFGPVSIGAGTVITPDQLNNFGPSIWYEGRISYIVSDDLTSSMTVGYQQFFEESSTGFPAELSNYSTWSAGLTYRIDDSFSADIRYYDNDSKVDFGEIYDPRIVVSVTRSF